MNSTSDMNPSSFVTPERPALGKTAPPPLRRVNAFATASPFPEYESTDEEDLMNRLRTFRAELQMKQDELYKSVTTTEQVAHADTKHKELTDKISAIESLLLACRSFFRTR